MCPTAIKIYYMLRACYVASVMSNSVQPNVLQPARLLCPWDSPMEWVEGKNTGVGCHFLLQGIFPTQELNLGLLNCRRFFPD